MRNLPPLIFLSALLAFVVQPMEGKALLPWFGGGSSVWAVGLLFFTAFLFAGYLYVFLLVRYGGDRQLRIHQGVIAVAVVAAAIPQLLHGPARRDMEWVLVASIPPQLGVFLALLFSIGAPYFLLATTAPLLQYWWGRGGGGEPYRLYALSNAGSLLALLAYPLFVEPRLALELQRGLWYLLFATFAGLYLLATRRAAASFGYAPSGEGADANQDDVALARAGRAAKRGLNGAVSRIEGADVIERRDARQKYLFRIGVLGYAAIPAYLLVAVTTHVTQVVAPVPLLWTFPLALYLVSYILAFRGVGGSVGNLLALLVVAGATLWVEGGDRATQAELQISLALLLLFMSGIVFHSRLFALRPALSELPLFYLLVSAGGVAGTLCGSLLPPLFFPDLWEYPLGIPLVVAASGRLLGIRIGALWKSRTLVYGVQTAALVVAGIGVVSAVADDRGTRLARSRSFYGAAAVSLEGELVVLSHGKTRHGSQFSDRDRSMIPTAYYAPASGAGRAIQHLAGRTDEALRVGLVGLGAGTLAAYCRPGDTYTFYELDPGITSLARRYFSYMDGCPGVSVRHGDARVVLERERRGGEAGGYDLLAIDAFTDDTVPVHLLTVEAFRLYLDHLAPGGILAVHTSNIYIELAPVVIRIAEEIGWSYLIVHDWTRATPGAVDSDWVLLAESPEEFRSDHFESADSYTPLTEASLWTDGYSSILPLLRGYQLLVRRLGG